MRPGGQAPPGTHKLLPWPVTKSSCNAPSLLQARLLRQQLHTMNLPDDALWVTSPLSRAMQTLMHACPALNGGGGAPPKIVVRRCDASFNPCLVLLFLPRMHFSSPSTTSSLPLHHGPWLQRAH